MTITVNSTSKTGKNVLKTLSKNHQNNLKSDYTEKIQNLNKDFSYEKNKDCYWSEPRFSLFYGTPLYEQASPTQKLALNHLFWTLFYKTTADSEIEVTHYNLLTAGTLLAMNPDYKMIAEQLEHETEQERIHIHGFYNISYKTQKFLFGKPKKSDLGNNPKNNSNLKYLSIPLNYIAKKLLPNQGKYKSPYFQELAQKNIHFVTKTQGFFNGYQGNSSRFLLQFIVENWGSSPFLACNFYGVRYFANLILKNYEHKVVKYYKKQKKQGESLPIPTAISYYHFLDEAFHTTTSLFISRDLYRQLPPPSAYEKLIANLGFYFTQWENFASLSAILPNRFTGDRTLLPYAYQLLQNPVFEFSPQEALHWLEKCLCQEHEGFHNNLNLHQHLLNDCRHFTSKLDYLWSVNREMRLTVAGGSIAKATAQNKKAFQQFAKSI